MPGVVFAWMLAAAVILQPPGCAWTARRKGLDASVRVAPGCVFGMLPGLVLAWRLLMMVGFGAEEDSWIVVLVLLGCLWPLFVTRCLPEPGKRTLPGGRRRRRAPLKR